jgi:hypothetical protein
MVTGRGTRRHNPRPPHPSCSKRTAVRSSTVHCFRTILLRWIFLSLLPLKPCPDPRTRWLLTTHQHWPTKPLRCPSSQHISSSHIRSIHYLSAPQSNGGKPKKYNPSTINHYPTRHLLHPPTSLGIFWNFTHISEGIYGSTFFIATDFTAYM